MTLEPQVPIVLDAITLRGIGSYLFGARLDIKPLTILCGANGSGKSTWLKALAILEASLKADRFPFGFPVADWDPRDIQLTNAYYHLANQEECDELDDAAVAESFGTPGTIGLELHATGDCHISNEWNSPSNDDGSLKVFLNNGLCRAGTRFRIRVAHPTYHDDFSSTPDLRHFVELQLDGKHSIRMESERDPHEKFEKGFSRPRRSKPYLLLCSRSFLTGQEDDAGVPVEIASILDLNQPRVDLFSDEVDASAVVWLLNLFEKRMRELLSHALRGFFYIGAVRQPHTSLKLRDQPRNEDESPPKARYVGAAGEHAWWLERRFAWATMRRITEPRFKAADTTAALLRESMSSSARESNPQMERLFNRMAQDHRERIEEVILSGRPAPEERKNQILADALNSLLEDRGLFDWVVWGREECNADGDTTGYVIDDPEIKALGERRQDAQYAEDTENLPDVVRSRRRANDLSLSELHLLNYLLIMDAFQDGRSLILPTQQQYTFSEYLSCWLQQLVNVGLNPTASPRRPNRVNQWTVSVASLSTRLSQPTAFMVAHDGSTVEPSPDMARLVHPCFGDGVFAAAQPPRQLSAGFHQLFPIMVQLGLMDAGELIGIENPEVHLHPALQVKMTEMLLEHAKSGRHIIVETHSDLVLRRVIRAILEESVAQSQVQIYFAGLSQKQTTKHGELAIEFHSSSLEQIRIDENGRIANWPEGFLDEDVRESQRLMDIMYGGRGEDDDDE